MGIYVIVWGGAWLVEGRKGRVRGIQLCSAYVRTQEQSEPTNHKSSSPATYELIHGGKGGAIGKSWAPQSA